MQRFCSAKTLQKFSAVHACPNLHLELRLVVPHRHGRPGNALLLRVAELDLGEGEFRVIAAHLGLFRRSRMDQVGTLLSAFLDLPPMPTILLGDLNERRRRGRCALRGLEQTFGVAPPIFSFPSRRPIFPLDRILGWPAGLITDLAVHDTSLARRSSDPLPLTAKVNLMSAIPALRIAA
jgi:endonuclease/exonuclease/phosphatase family metal-dependent hydrolase